ncbi:MAG: putative membrane protein YczE, partial [Yoonia sp.]
MTSASKLQSLTKQSRDTLDMLDVGGKFIMEERSKHEAARLIIETSLCVIVGIVFLGSFMLFIMPEISLLRDYSGVSLSMAMVGIAMTLYVFATRGFIPQAGFDKSKK